MAETPRELKVAMSYLEDVDNQRERIKAMDNEYIAQDRANELITGDLSLARKEIEKAAAQGIDVTHARAFASYKEGRIATAVLASAHLDGGLIKRWKKKAAEAFQAAVSLDPSPLYYYWLGLSLDALGQREQSLQALREAQKTDDQELSVEASKAIGRIESEMSQKSGPCFVATAAYGSPYAEQVVCLRRFRDEVLRNTWFGPHLVRLYERLGPCFACAIGERPYARALVRAVLLKPVLWAVRKALRADRDNLPQTHA